MNEIDSIIHGQGFNDFTWINARDIEVAQWVRVKCQFGCPDYGLGTCPPNTPSVDECKTFFKEYKKAVVIRLSVNADKDDYPSGWSKLMTKKLLEIEKQIFLKGFPKVFLLNQTCCNICADCTGDRLQCSDKTNSRPSPESFAVDVYNTLKNSGIELYVVNHNPSDITRIALIMIE